MRFVSALRTRYGFCKWKDLDGLIFLLKVINGTKILSFGWLIKFASFYFLFHLLNKELIIDFVTFSITDFKESKHCSLFFIHPSFCIFRSFLKWRMLQIFFPEVLEKGYGFETRINIIVVLGIFHTKWSLLTHLTNFN